MSSSEYDYDRESEKREECKQKSKKRRNYFNNDWQQTYSWLLKGKEEGTAKCIACNSEFSIANGGVYDVKKHMKTGKHIKQVENSARTPNILSFFNSTSTAASTKNNYRTAAAEDCFAYHTVQHAHSYNSANCSNSLFSVIFPDSKIAQTFSCGRTKLTKVVTNVLAKESRKLIIQDLSGNHPFSLATDASNKGNIKMFPLVVRYFKKDVGVQTKLLNFFDSSSETSKIIANCLIEKLKEANLNPQNVISYCADNASVNFGKNQSVFVELQKFNSELIDVGCLCHVLNNSIKNASNCLKFDLECIIMKTYNTFCSHSKRKQELLEFYDFCDVEYSELLRHVPTRWLSLVPAIDRLYKNFEPIKSYFLSMSSCPALLHDFFTNDLAEAYLGLVSNIGTLIQNVILKLEGEGPIIIEIYDLLSNLRNSLKSKLEQKYYGMIAHQAMQKCDDFNEVNLFKKRAEAFISKIVDYVEQRFDFTQNRFEILKIFKLETMPTFEKILELLQKFPIKNINTDILFEEYVILKQKFPSLENLSFEQKWVTFLNTCQVPNFEKIVNFVFALAHSNAMSERMFSLMFQAWRKDRNRLSLKTIEAEIMVKHNYGKTCKDFYNYVLENEKLLKTITSNEKYVE
ncbi:uncharacterized protein LOC116159067 [Photinus pyralis]|uniref:uncharacterized protein LOC116159067 n=1 Tax=Photinus pyralis TaxID=7054 RepID=UPI0012675353|nr:uncharacterized protein LOC116159067 [Photinus pyralis]